MLFSSTPQMEAIGIECLRIISIGFMFSGIVIVLSTAFQALGKANASLVISFSRQIIVLLQYIVRKAHSFRRGMDSITHKELLNT